MEKILEKLSNYDIFTNLLPGVIVGAALEEIFGWDISASQNFFITLVVLYFIGMVISRIGSQVLEPIMKRAKFTSWSDYKKYIKASTRDPKIELLTEVANTYRSLAVVGFLIGIPLIIAWFAGSDSGTLLWGIAWVVIGALFLASYRKQNQYVCRRVEEGGSK